MVTVMVVAAWFLLALGVALVVGGGIRAADRSAPVTDHLVGLPEDFTVADILAAAPKQPTV